MLMNAMDEKKRGRIATEIRYSAEIAKAKAMYATGMPMIDIALALKLSRQTLYIWAKKGYLGDWHREPTGMRLLKENAALRKRLRELEIENAKLTGVIAGFKMRGI